MSKLGALLHSEIVQVYGSFNAILGALVVLNVVTLTPDQIAALLVILNAVLAPIVRGLVTPTAVRAAAVTVPPVIMHDSPPDPPPA